LKTWELTGKGYEVANAILHKFMSTTESLEDIAQSFGLSTDEARVIIMMAEAGGIVRVGEDTEDDNGVE
jgi:hypothetical protein